MENGEKVIGMLHPVTIWLWYRSHKCTPSWASNDEEEYTEVTEKLLEETSDEAECPLTNAAITPPGYVSTTRLGPTHTFLLYNLRRPLHVVNIISIASYISYT